MQTAWLIDGKHQTGVSPADRGLAYGDGLFETIAAPAGQIRLFDAHLNRLRSGCERLGFAAPDRSDIEQDIARLSPGPVSHVVKIIVTRGVGGRGYRPPASVSPTRIVGVFPWPDYPAERYREGIRAIYCRTRIGENSALAGLKHLCRLENVLAQQEVAAAGAHEGLMRSSRGHIVSGTMSNVFAVRDGALLTPRLDRCGIAGIMRNAVIEAAASLGIRCHERRVSAADLEAAGELFCCNSVLGIWPICVLGDVAFEVGTLTQSIMEYLAVVPPRSASKADA
jgi:4-amino-4-deoxychorismate lyase